MYSQGSSFPLPFLSAGREYRCGVVYVWQEGAELPAWVPRKDEDGGKAKAVPPPQQPLYLVRAPDLSVEGGSTGAPPVPNHFAWVTERYLKVLFSPHFPPHRELFLTDFCATSALSLQAAVLEDTSFPLGKLPSHVIALVLAQLPLPQGAMLALTCKKFLAAFRDDLCWRLRALADIQVPPLSHKAPRS
jgi:hypothetical protein